MKFGHVNTLSFGTLMLPCEIQYSQELKESILLPQEMANRLMIPNNGKTHLFFNDGTLHLGPLIGI
ncbi:hypothetical protein CHH61_26805, partial [Shouchella clausii]